jgi:hypothetical protein
MKSRSILFVFLVFYASILTAAPENGRSAPAFEATTDEGITLRLSDLLGKPVVLEWVNHGCPFVKKHYGSGNMQRVQSRAKELGAVWLSVVSSAPGKQGFLSPDGSVSERRKRGSHADHVLLDASGQLGRLYAAKTTPHLYVIDSAGVLVYQGAVDSISSADPSDAAKAQNYVLDALEALREGKPVEPAFTRAYGCAIKY